jgi:hypothetical protein
MQDEHVRIQMTGVAEQSARSCEHVIVRIQRPGEASNLAPQQIPGIVRGASDVEMER